eukprot:2055_1
MSYPMPLVHESSSLPYDQWCSMLKIELKDKSKINVEQRLTKIEELVNTIISEHRSRDEKYFSITDDVKLKIMTDINAKIDSWRGVEIDLTKNKEKKNFVSYQSTARNWFNRNKAKIYGNHLFYEIIFNHILKFCSELSDVIDSQRMMIFIAIFDGIMCEPVQFPRTKLQPLLPHQALMQPNRFKKACERFTMYYDIKWQRSLIDGKRDRGRAKKIHESFMNCLIQIKNEVNTNGIRPIPYPFDSIMDKTMASITMDLPPVPDELKLSHEVSDLSHTTDDIMDDIPPNIDHLFGDEPPSFVDPFMCNPSPVMHAEHGIYPPDYNPYNAYVASPVHVHADTMAYQASHAPRSNGYNVSHTRYSPMSNSHCPTPYGEPYAFPSAYNERYDDDLNTDFDLNEHHTFYDDDSFVFTNLSHTQSPTPLFGGFL